MASGEGGEVWGAREEGFMRLALAQAVVARKIGEVPVGCVLVHGDAVVGEGSNRTNVTRNGTRHAEFEAIDQVLAAHGDARARAMFPEMELFVTCEPCIMCAGALSSVRIGRVWYGCANDKFGGNSSIMDIHRDGCGSCSSSAPLRPALRAGGGGDVGRGKGAGPGAGMGGTYPSVGGLFAEEAIELLRDFYVTGNPKAPKPHRKVRADRGANGATPW